MNCSSKDFQVSSKILSATRRAMKSSRHALPNITFEFNTTYNSYSARNHAVLLCTGYKNLPTKLILFDWISVLNVATFFRTSSFDQILSRLPVFNLFVNLSYGSSVWISTITLSRIWVYLASVEQEREQERVVVNIPRYHSTPFGFWCWPIW